MHEHACQRDYSLVNARHDEFVHCTGVVSVEAQSKLLERIDAHESDRGAVYSSIFSRSVITTDMMPLESTSCIVVPACVTFQEYECLSLVTIGSVRDASTLCFESHE